MYVLWFRGSNVPENLNLDQSTLTPIPFETNNVAAHMIRMASSHVVATAGRCTFSGLKVSMLPKIGTLLLLLISSIQKKEHEILPSPSSKDKNPRRASTSVLGGPERRVVEGGYTKNEK